MQKDFYTPCQTTITSNEAEWTHLIQEWTLNTKEIFGAGGASGWYTCRARWTLEGTWKSSALKYRTLTFRKTFNSNNKRIERELKDIIHSMRPIIKGQIEASAEAIKWYLSKNMNFCKSTKPTVKTDLTLMFGSVVFKSIGTHGLDYQFYVVYNQMVQQNNEFQRNSSGWVVDYLQHLDLGICFL